MYLNIYLSHSPITMTQENNDIIIDNGSCNTKFGLSFIEKPGIIPTCLGLPKYERIMGYFSIPKYHKINEHYIGYSALGKRAVLTIDYPIEHGVVNNWDGMEMIWNYIFSEILNIEPEEHNIILTEPSLNPKENREKFSQIFFETYQVPSLYIANQAILALNSTGRSTGIVVESGDGVTQIVPIFSSYSLSHAVRRLDFAGRDLTEFLLRLLSAINYRFTSSAEKDIAKDIKEKACYVAEHFETEKIESYLYELPDGNHIFLNKQRIECPEALLNPNLMNKEQEGIVEACYNSIQNCDIDIKKDLYYNIILSGGNLNFRGLKERFSIEMKRLVPLSIDVKVTDAENKMFSVWNGAKMFSKLPGMESLWITKEEYEESGATIVHRKCF